MRRHILAAFVVTLASLAASAVPSAQSPDAVIATARTMANDGNHDAALALLRGALASRPSDAAIRAALVEMLVARRVRLQAMVEETTREIAGLGGAASVSAGCDGRAPIEVGKAIAAPARIEGAIPAYPQEARDAGIGGIVVMRLTIGCDGEVAEVEVLQGVPALNDAAADAARRWRYRPTLMNGVPVPVTLHATITFTPRE